MKRLLIGLVLIGLVATPTFGAESSSESKNAGDKGTGPGGGMFSGKLLEQLNLTEEQKHKFQELREKYAPQMKEQMQKGRGQLEGVLTDEQKQKVREMRQQGVTDRKEIFEKLNLTEEQKQKLRGMRQNGGDQSRPALKEFVEEFRNILTDEQKAKLKELMEKAREHHGKRDKSNS